MKKIYLLLLISIFSMNICCQVQWTKSEFNPVLETGLPGDWDNTLIIPSSVLSLDSVYHMWYWGTNSLTQGAQIGHATSTDGISWNKDTVNNPVLGPGPSGSWDDHMVNEPTVLFIDSVFHMWYNGHTGSDLSKDVRIGHATSPDGIAWTKDTMNNPVLDLGVDGSWDDTWIACPTVVFDGSEFHIWYSAYNGTTSESIKFGHASSSDGILWTKDPANPVLTSQGWDSPRVDFPEVVFDGTEFHMWYSGGSYFGWQIGYATSYDGFNWSKHDKNPVLETGTTGTWDVQSVVTGAVIFDSADSKYKMWYGGSSSFGTGDIGYAESKAPPWKKLTPMDMAKGGAASAVIDDKIYVFGGTRSNLASLNTTDVYNTETDEWLSLAPVPIDLTYTNAGLINGKIYLAAGWRNPGEWITIDSTYAYDPVADSWETKKECPKKSGGHASCVLDGKLYLFGGLKDFPSKDFSGQKDALVYDPATDTWDALTDMLFERGGGATASVYDGQIYVFGSLVNFSASDFQVSRKAERYNPVSNTWSELADMPVSVVGHMSLVYKNKMYVFGGDSSMILNRSPQRSWCTDIIQEYDPSTDQWRLMDPMPFNRSDMTGQKVGDFVYVIGGYPDNSRDFPSVLSEVWKMHLDSLQEGCDELRIEEPSKSLLTGDIYKLRADVLPIEFANKAIVWTSDNELVATVTEEGVLECISAGTVTISAKLKYGGCSDSYMLTIHEAAWVLMNEDDPGGRTCIVDSLIYSFAGGGEDWVIGNNVNSYNTSTNEWSELSPMPMAMTEGGIGMVGDKICLVGGWRNLSLDEWVTVDSILEYDPSMDSWSFKDKCPFKIGSSASCVMNDKIYLFGGWGNFNAGETYANDAFTYDPVNELWDTETLPDMHYPHLMLGTAELLDGKIYLLGGTGLAPDFSPQRSEVFDGEKWEPISEMPVPVVLHTSIVHDDKILVFGGDSIWQTSGSFSCNFIQEYDPVTDVWRMMEPMPFQRAGMAGGKVGNYLYLMGGAPDDRDQSTTVSEVWKFNLDSLKEWVVLCEEVLISQSELTLEVDDTETLSASVLPSYVADRTLSWSSSDDGVVSVSDEGVLTAVSGGEATITATAGGGGCTASCVLTVNPTVGVPLSGTNKIKIFPNPSTTTLSVESGSPDLHHIRINSLNGQLIYTGEMKGGSLQIDLSSFEKGAYFITVSSEDIVITRKVIKL